jgi:hypothetical protein
MSSPTPRRWLVLVLALLLPLAAQAQLQAKVYVVLWFDTEDYILPASDDAALRLSQFLTSQGVRATFKVVGEKARTLERRKRTDVIESLRKHEIGYHSNWHSVQPSPAMYLSNLGWDEGVAEFDRREGPGRADVERIFGQPPSCYGQPGSSWGPQSYGAMRKWGMRVYLDAGRHVDLDGKPCWFDGVLNLYSLRQTVRADLNDPGKLDAAREIFAAARKALQAEGGGVISILYHPCEFVHKKFWDGVNFDKGANPPREQWRLPPQKTAEESRISYQVFQDYLLFMKRFPDVHFVTASEVLRLYRDRSRERSFDRDDLREIATAVKDEVGFQVHKRCPLSASEVFLLLNNCVAGREGNEGRKMALKTTPYGPTGREVSLGEGVVTEPSQLLRTSLDVADFIEAQGRVPSAVWLGSVAVPPEAYLATVARLVPDLLDGKLLPERIEVRPGKLTAARYVSEDNPGLWGWVIFPRGFRAPELMRLARQQAWALKPALLDQDTADGR